MNEDINDKFYEPLADDHLVMINKDTFTVARLKELVNINLREKLAQRMGNGNFSLASWLYHPLKIVDGEVLIDMKEMMWVFPQAGIKCQLLKIDNGRFQGWKLGKSRVQSSINFIIKGGTNETINISSILEFCPDDILDFHKTCEETNKD